MLSINQTNIYLLKQKILCFLLTVGYMFANAQTKNFFFKTLTTKNGLSYNLVNCLLEDREGYIWIGTFNGLNRYDGFDFVVFKYDRNNPNSIAHNNVLSICEDKQGDIWIATPNGVRRYNKRSNIFTNYLPETKTKDASESNDAGNILCDRHGTIWVTTDNGLFKFNSLSSSFTAYKNDPKNIKTISSNWIERNAFTEDPEHDLLWIGTDKGLNCFDTRNEVFYNYKNNPAQLPVFNDNIIYPVTFDKKNKLVFGDNSEKK